MANEKNIEFVKTTSSKLDDVLTMENGRYQKSFIHTHDESENNTVDDQLYIGEDRITDNFNIGNLNPATPTRSIGGLSVSTIGQLKEKTVSQILIDILAVPIIPTTGINLNKSTASLEVGQTVTITATVTPSNASDKSVTWTTSDSTVGTVSNTGVVTARGVGETTITATCAGFSKTCVVTVNPTIPTVRSNPSISLIYNGNTLIGVGDTLPTKSGITVNISYGSWSDGTPYAGAGEVTLTMNPDMWGQEATEGTYTISGSSTLTAGGIPKDNVGTSYPNEQYQGGTTINTTSNITITAINPIFVNGYKTSTGDDNLDITHMRKYVFNYTNETNLEITVPIEVEDPTPVKFKVAVARQLSKFVVKQFNPLTQTYDIDVPMKYVTDHYERVDDYTNTKPTKYKLTLKK